MSKIIASHKPAEVFTFLKNTQPEILKNLLDINFNEQDSLSKNYTHDMKWEEFDAISIYKRDSKIIGFSSIWHREEYYEKKECRILNRYWESSDMRRTSKIIGDDHLIEMVKQQLDFCKELGYKKAFISRERTPRYFKQLISTIAEKTKTKWIIENDKVCVCKPSNPSCWQYKAWTEL